MFEQARDHPFLYSFRRCPYAMRARLAIWMSGRHVMLREILLRDKPRDMLNLSPKGTVPVLCLTDGKVIDESLDVMFWAINGTSIIGPNIGERECIAVFDDQFKFHLDRYKYAARYEGVTAKEHRDAAVEILRDQVRLEGQLWLCGESSGFLDWAILPFIRQFRIADPEWFDTTDALTEIRPWLHQFLGWEVFQMCLKKYPVWSEGQPGIIFGRALNRAE